MSILSCDFETTTDPTDCRVWAWSACEIKSLDCIVGTDIDGFMECVTAESNTLYFHNLKFDGNFIVYWLLTNGYQWKNSKDEHGRRYQLAAKEFTTCISDMGAWYTITIATSELKHIEIRDSLKIIPMPVEDIPKTFGFDDIEKGGIDFSIKRERGHVLTEEEELYVRNDSIIVARALTFMLDNGQNKLTAASNALNDYKSRLEKKEFNKLFPPLSEKVDLLVRKTYKGGWTYLNPAYKNLDVKEGAVYDINSMYPWAMKMCLLPYGKPIEYYGEPKISDNYPLYTVSFDCEFKLKPGKYPSIQLKHTMGYADNEYLTSSDGVVTLHLTSVDFELFKECYDSEIFTYHGGFYFKGKHGMFDSYIDHWFSVKTDAKETKNPGMEKLAKLMLNSLYGKFGSRMFGRSKIPYYDDVYDCVRYKRTDEEKRKGGYVPVASFITSYCRQKIITSANLCGDRFIYGDTDSLHILGTEPPSIEIDNFRLGAFKEESVFKRAKFIRQKTYMEIISASGKESLNIKACGMPNKLKNSLREEDFYEGAEYDHAKNERFSPKLVPKVVPGGVILTETTFSIKVITTTQGSEISPASINPGEKVRKPLTKRKKRAKIGVGG